MSRDVFTNSRLNLRVGWTRAAGPTEIRPGAATERCNDSEHVCRRGRSDYSISGRRSPSTHPPPCLQATAFSRSAWYDVRASALYCLTSEAGSFVRSDHLRICPVPRRVLIRADAAGCMRHGVRRHCDGLREAEGADLQSTRLRRGLPDPRRAPRVLACSPQRNPRRVERFIPLLTITRLPAS